MNAVVRKILRSRVMGKVDSDQKRLDFESLIVFGR